LPDAKEFVVIGGPNGAGKSTYAHELIQAKAVPYLSADAIAGELSPENPTSARVRAGRLFLERLRQRVIGEESFIIESTLSGLGVLRQIQAARGNGFEVTIVFIFLDSPETCIARVRERVRGGGHDVPAGEVRRRYHRSLSNFWQRYRLLADRWLLSYNAAPQFQDVALGTATTTTVRDELLFGRFLALSGGGT
jgi:predicted ABC-type ATPase